MKTHSWILIAIAMGILAINCHVHAQNPPLTRFYLSETITGATTGPIPAIPGTRFKTATGDWKIVSLRGNEILFSDASTGQQYGPYGFQPQRIIMLGDKAMLFSKIENTAAHAPPVLRQPLAKLPTSPAPVVAPRAEAPEGWDRQPLPSTNPGEHLNRPVPFSLSPRKYPRTLELWFEPLHAVKYDWSLGGFAGNSGQKMESSRIGASGIWQNFFVEAAYINDAKIGGSIVPDGTTLSDLNLKDGSGFSLCGSYVYSFVIDENWNASFGGFIQYEHTSFDMKATVLTRGGEVISPETETPPSDETITHSYEFKTSTSSLRLQETTLGAFGGIDYTAERWGAGVNLIINLYTDVNTSGSIEIVDDRYAVSAKQTHPVGVVFSSWVSPLDDFFVSGQFMVGTENSIRIGIGKKF